MLGLSRGTQLDAPRAPQYYREKIKAEAEGRAYVAPPPSKAASFGGAKSGGMTRNAKSFQEGGWDDWGDAGGKAAKVGAAPSPAAHHLDLQLVLVPCSMGLMVGAALLCSPQPRPGLSPVRAASGATASTRARSWSPPPPRRTASSPGRCRCLFSWCSARACMHAGMHPLQAFGRTCVTAQCLCQ